MNNNNFDMGLLEYFYYHPCCKCKKQYGLCGKPYGGVNGTHSMILNRLEKIMIDNMGDCWEGENDEN